MALTDCKAKVLDFDADSNPDQGQTSPQSIAQQSIKVLTEEKIRIHEFEQDLDVTLQRIILKDFSVSAEFATKHVDLFASLPHCAIGDSEAVGYTVNAEFDSFLSKGIELWKKSVFTEPRAEMFWHVNFYMPLLSLCCLAPVPSGLLKFQVSDKITLGPTARHLFSSNSSGILPDACDGWMFVKSYTQAGKEKRPAKILFNKFVYDAKTLPVAQYDYLCGDANILMLDLLAEFKGSDDLDVEHDRDKLIGEMAVASQCFVQALSYNPYVFGITTSGPQFRFYALRSNEKEKSYEKQSEHKTMQNIIEEGKKQGITQKRSISKPELFVAGDAPDGSTKEEQTKKDEKEMSAEQNLDAFYECFYLANVQISNFATYVQVLMILWRIRVARDMNLRRYYSTLPDQDEVEQAVSSTDDVERTNSNNNSNTNTQEGNASNNNNNNADVDIVASDLNKLKVVLSQLDLAFVEQFPNSNDDSLVVKAIGPDSSPVVVKLYANKEDFEHEKKIYEWLENLSFSSKPKLIRWFETKMIRGLVLECLTGQHKLRITSERALLSFTVALLKAIEKLHACHVIHGDIKRSNIVYDGLLNEVKLLDFGLSEILIEKDYTHRRGQTPGFLQYYYQPMRFRDDLCKIGVMLCELIYGVDPSEVGYDRLLEMTHEKLAQTLFPVSPAVISFVHAMLDVTQVYDASYALQEPLFYEFRHGPRGRVI